MHGFAIYYREMQLIDGLASLTVAAGRATLSCAAALEREGSLHTHPI